MGQKLAAYNSVGAILAFYDTVDSPPPVNATVLAITNAQWLVCINNPGWTVQAGVLCPPVSPSSAQLLIDAQQVQISALAASCAAAITAGFTSSALGSAYTYPSDILSQANLMTAQQSGATVSLWCESATGVWSFASHTAPQAAKALSDFVAYRVAQQAHYATQVAAVSAATTVAAVQAINW
jgi:hypothetical protein